MEPALPDWVQPGAVFRQMRGGALGNVTFHVRGIVDGQAVVRHWRASKRYWEYSVKDVIWFELSRIEIVKRGG